MRVDREADDPARRLADERLARREKRRVRPAVAERHAEPLRVADDGVGAHLAGRHQQRQREQIGRDGDERPGGVRAFDDRPQIASLRRAIVGILQQQAERAVSTSAATPARSPISSRMSSGSARPRSTSSVCGKQRSDTRNTLSWPAGAFFVCSRWNIVIASAAAVPSSRSDAVAMSMPVRSFTTVWKFSSDSSRPCAISAWYGVYGVYQPGFSKHVAQDDAGRDAVVVAHADVRPHDPVRAAAMPRSRAGSRYSLSPAADRAASAARMSGRNRLVDQRVERRHADGREHLRRARPVGADVSGLKAAG